MDNIQTSSALDLLPGNQTIQRRLAWCAIDVATIEHVKAGQKRYSKELNAAKCDDALVLVARFGCASS